MPIYAVRLSKAKKQGAHIDTHSTISKSVRSRVAAVQVSGADIFVDEGTDIMEAAKYMEGMPAEAVAGAYAFYDEASDLQFVGISQHLQLQFEVLPLLSLLYRCLPTSARHSALLYSAIPYSAMPCSAVPLYRSTADPCRTHPLL